MLTLTELRRAAHWLDERLCGHRLRAVTQSDETSVVLSTYGGPPESTRKRILLLVAQPGSARISELARVPKALAQPPAFTQYARAHLVGGVVREVGLWNEDRQLALRVETAEGVFDLVLQILGPRSNVYVVDGEGRLVAALRPLRDTRSELAMNAPWIPPASSPPREGDDRFADVPDDELLLAVEAHYAGAEQERQASDAERRVSQVLAKERKTLGRKLEKLERELEAAESAIVCERHGELLKGVIGSVKRGDTEVVARDHASGEDVAIPLDPQKSPSENLEALFKRYRKALRTLTKGGAQQDAIRSDLAAVVAEQDAWAELAGDGEATPAALEAFAERPLAAKLLGRAGARATRSKEAAEARLGAEAPERKLAGRVVPGRLMPRRYRTAGGLEVWVGRSDAANDFLSTRLARGKDLFFHLDGAPGSHVILRTEGKADPPSEAVLDACELAVHFSKAKKASRADVHVVPIANVKKPKGAKPGLVTVHGGKSIHLRREPARLARVLADRVDN